MSGGSWRCGGGCCGCSAPPPAAAAGAPPRARRCGAALPAPPPAGSRGGPWRASSSTVGALSAGERRSGCAALERGRCGNGAAVRSRWGAVDGRRGRGVGNGASPAVLRPSIAVSFPLFLLLSSSAGTCTRSDPLSAQRPGGAGDPGHGGAALGAGCRSWQQPRAAGSRGGAALCLPSRPAAWCGHSRPGVPASRGVLTATRVAPSLLELHQMAAVLNVTVPRRFVVLVTPCIRM